MHLWFRLSKIVASVALLQKGIFYFFDNVRKFHETFRGKVCFVNYIISVLNWFNWFFWNRKIKISVLLTFKAIELDLIGQNLFFLLRSLRELLAYSRYGSSAEWIHVSDAITVKCTIHFTPGFVTYFCQLYGEWTFYKVLRCFWSFFTDIWS